MRPYPLLALLLLTACQPSPPPAPPPAAVAPAHALTPTPDPTDEAIDNFLAVLNQADPNGALVSENPDTALRSPRQPLGVVFWGNLSKYLLPQHRIMCMIGNVESNRADR